MDVKTMNEKYISDMLDKIMKEITAMLKEELDLFIEAMGWKIAYHLAS